MTIFIVYGVLRLQRVLDTTGNNCIQIVTDLGKTTSLKGALDTQHDVVSSTDLIFQHNDHGMLPSTVQTHSTTWLAVQ